VPWNSTDGIEQLLHFDLDLLFWLAISSFGIIYWVLGFPLLLEKIRCVVCRSHNGRHGKKVKKGEVKESEVKY
jgi:hypothetical protein